jgi:predicted aspartyl protease
VLSAAAPRGARQFPDAANELCTARAHCRRNGTRRFSGKIGVMPRRTETFGLADGSRIRRKVGEVRFELQGKEGVSKVVFGRSGDSSLLGALTLETLGLTLNPLKRTLHPLKLMIA